MIKEIRVGGPDLEHDKTFDGESIDTDVRPEQQKNAEQKIERGVEAGREDDARRTEKIEEVQAKIASADSGSRQFIPKPLTGEEKNELGRHIETLKRDVGRKVSSVTRGNDTAADYDCHVHTFSTKTSLVRLESGRRIFVVFNYPASWIHRKLDGLMKKLTSRKISKADSKNWKETFERRTQIPTIPNDDPNVVTMDYIPNVNLYDLFSNRAEKDKDGTPLIKDFGECGFAGDMDVEGLLGVVEKVIDKTRTMHEQNLHWGELNLPNIIIDKDQEVHICDPETEYSKKVPVAERRARDLFVFLMSSTAAMNRAEKVDHAVTIKRALDRYQLDDETKTELKKVVEKPMTLGQKLFFGYTKANYALKDRAEYEKIMKNVAEYLA